MLLISFNRIFILFLKLDKYMVCSVTVLSKKSPTLSINSQSHITSEGKKFTRSNQINLNRISQILFPSEKCKFSTLKKEKLQICINFKFNVLSHVHYLILFHFSVEENVSSIFSRGVFAVYTLLRKSSFSHFVKLR